MKDKKLEFLWDRIKINSSGKDRVYPLLKVEISGHPNLGDLRKLLQEIKEETKNIKEEYISVTDMRNLELNSFFQSIVLLGMDLSYKQLLSMSNPSLLSFVILDESQSKSKQLRKTLNRINEAGTSEDYRYNYLYITDFAQLKEIAQKILT